MICDLTFESMFQRWVSCLLTNMLQTIKSVQSIKRKTIVRQTLSQTVLVVEKKYDEFSFIARKMKKKHCSDLNALFLHEFQFKCYEKCVLLCEICCVSIHLALFSCLLMIIQDIVRWHTRRKTQEIVGDSSSFT